MISCLREVTKFQVTKFALISGPDSYQCNFLRTSPHSSLIPTRILCKLTTCLLKKQLWDNRCPFQTCGWTTFTNYPLPDLAEACFRTEMLGYTFSVELEFLELKIIHFKVYHSVHSQCCASGTSVRLHSIFVTPKGALYAFSRHSPFLPVSLPPRPRP